MRRGLGRAWLVVVAAATMAPSGCPNTKVELTMLGGFGYVVNPDLTMSAGFMKSSMTPTCHVPQFGVQLTIDEGEIVSPAGYPARIDVTNDIVTLAGLTHGAVDFSGKIGRHLKRPTVASSDAAMSNPGSPNNSPQPPRSDERHWTDLFWIPHTRLSYLDKRLDGWQDRAVTGYLTVGGGTLSAGIPSNPDYMDAIWEFRTSTATKYKQAITDRLHWKGEVASPALVILLEDRTTHDKRRIIVAPSPKRHTVGLTLVGLHDPDDMMPPGAGDPLKHFCTFYQMIDPATPIPPVDRLMPYLGGSMNSSTGAMPANAQPTPGAYCPGDWP